MDKKLSDKKREEKAKIRCARYLLDTIEKYGGECKSEIKTNDT